MIRDQFLLGIDSTKARRPAILKIATELRRKHPNWSDNRVLIKAKAAVLSQKGSAE
ncbi:hypothetical protein [Chromobacterium haemolyticum]|uniref:hypothetical protein n=1 Tax=Chromobacterium haemolyticum TaxID=394935 RepID=UPI0013B3C892|nr:hypothetical protein [Chromobacterium haemolyticum]